MVLEVVGMDGQHLGMFEGRAAEPPDETGVQRRGERTFGCFWRISPIGDEVAEMQKTREAELWGDRRERARIWGCRVSDVLRMETQEGDYEHNFGMWVRDLQWRCSLSEGLRWALSSKVCDYRWGGRLACS